MPRPNKKESIAIKARNKEIYKNHKRGYSLSILAEFYNIDESVISRIIKESKIKPTGTKKA